MLTSTKTAPSTTELLPLCRNMLGGDRLLFSWWPGHVIEAVIPVAIDVLAESPGVTLLEDPRLGSRVWERCRALPVGPGGAPLDRVLAAVPGCTPLGDITELVRVLTRAGDVHASLLAQRRAIDGQIERLATLRSRREAR